MVTWTKIAETAGVLRQPPAKRQRLRRQILDELTSGRPYRPDVVPPPLIREAAKVFWRD